MRRLEALQGHEDRRNTLLLGPPSSGEDSHKHPADTVVFFPGDVQNFEAVMKHHPGNSKWKGWTFENTLAHLQKRFPEANVLMVLPSRRVEETLSCYGHFLEVDVLGSPVNFEPHHAWQHLKLLIEAAWKSMGEETTQVCDAKEDEKVQAQASQKVQCQTTPDSNITLIGFSKGCTVLNQLMHELKEATSDPSLLAFIRRINHLYWLDGGHAGTVPTYVVDQDVLSQVSRLKATIHVHVTPYQVKDAARPHIGEEHMKFVAGLMQDGADIKDTLHFRDESRCLKRHFEVLTKF